MEAYARIVDRVKSNESGKSIDRYITKLPATLGRTTVPKNPNEGEQVCIGAHDGILSRYHGIIFWNENLKKFQIKCLSKNGLIVDNIVYKKADTANLKEKSSIRMGNIRFFFIAANISIDPETQKLLPGTFDANIVKYKDGNQTKISYNVLVSYAFKSGLQDTIPYKGLHQREIVEWIASNFDGFSEPHKKLNLSQGVYMTLTKFYSRVPEVEGDDKKKKNRWLPKVIETRNNTEENDNNDEEEEDEDEEEDDDDEDDDEDEEEDENHNDDRLEAKRMKTSY